MLSVKSEVSALWVSMLPRTGMRTTPQTHGVQLGMDNRMTRRYLTHCQQILLIQHILL